MKKTIKLLSIAFFAVAILMSCEGPEGPAGTDGVDGIDGTEGTADCFACHTGTLIETIQAQFYTSQHALGDIAVDYAGGRGSCAECHSHQGFVEWALTGEVAEDFSAPEAWKCETCHRLHTEFDSTDWAFRAGGAVTLLMDGTTELDEGNNNTCLNCHQARRPRSDYDGTENKTYTRTFTGDAIAMYTTAAVGPAGVQGVLNGTGDTLTVVFDVPVATHVYISSEHAGPHHGPQGNLWKGLGGTIAGTAFSGHSGGCVMCHMGEASGHSFKPEEGNCEACHTSKEAEMEDIAERIEAIGEALEAIHAVHYSDEDGLFHPMYASLTTAQFNAWWNFTYVLEDRSNSAHNPTYIKSLISSCETALGL